MEPTSPNPTGPTGPTATGESLVTYVNSNRQSVAILLAAFAAVFIGVAIFLGVKAFRSQTAAKDPDKPLTADSPLPELPKSETELANLKQGDFTLGAVGCLLS